MAHVAVGLHSTSFMSSIFLCDISSLFLGFKHLESSCSNIPYDWRPYMCFGMEMSQKWWGASWGGVTAGVRGHLGYVLNDIVQRQMWWLAVRSRTHCLPLPVCDGYLAVLLWIARAWCPHRLPVLSFSIEYRCRYWNCSERQHQQIVFTEKIDSNSRDDVPLQPRVSCSALEEKVV